MPESNPTQDEILSAFVIKMINDKGLDGMSEEERSRLRMNLQDKLQEQIEKALIGMLSDEQLFELDRKLKADASDEEIEAFFLADGLNAEKAMTDAMKAFREAFLALPMEEVTGRAE